MSISRTANTMPPPMAGFEGLNRFWDHQWGCPVTKILPGEFCLVNKGELIATTLGSCIAACIRDPETGVGGMNHFMLPESSLGDEMTLGRAARFGSFAMEQLINEILRRGGQRHRLEVKIAGGGKIIQSMTDIGARNIAFVRQYLEREGLVIISEDVGGDQPRKVLYNPETGSMKVKRLQSPQQGVLMTEEQQYRHTLKNQPEQGDVTLF